MRTLRNFESGDRFVVTDAIKNNDIPPGSVLYVLGICKNHDSYPNLILCDAGVVKKGNSKMLRYIPRTICFPGVKSDRKSMDKILPIGSSDLVEIEKTERVGITDGKIDKFDLAMWLLVKGLIFMSNRDLSKVTFLNKSKDHITRNANTILSRIAQDGKKVIEEIDNSVINRWYHEIKAIKSAIIRQEAGGAIGRINVEWKVLQSVSAVNKNHFEVISQELLAEMEGELMIEEEMARTAAARLNI